MDRFISRRWGHGLIAGAGLALVALLGAILPSVTATRGAPLAAAVVVSATGANAAAIQPTVDAFRTALGTLNPNNRR